jgi:hypothetical protein
MKAATLEKPFRFSEKRRAELETLFEGQPQAVRFINDAQKIVANHRRMTTDYRELPATRLLQTNARAIQTAARQLSASLAQLADGEKDLLGQFMWMADKRTYFPAASSVDRIVESLAVVGRAAQDLARAGKNGRSNLQVDGLIRELHASYVTRFRKRTDLAVAQGSDFHSAVKLCLAEAQIPVTSLRHVVRLAIGE